jgi:hypothetical protein
LARLVGKTFPPALHPFPSRRPVGRRTLEKLSRVVQVVSNIRSPSAFRVREAVSMLFNAENNCRKLSELSDFFVLRLFVGLFVLFVSRKRPEKFFQSLEKSGEIFQPLEKSFPIIGKLPFSDGLADWPNPGCFALSKLSLPIRIPPAL